MTASSLLGTDEELAGRRLIAQMGTILFGARPDMPAGFATALFGRAALEDLLRYEPHDLASLAEQAWDFLQTRRPGTVKIRFESRPASEASERISTISIIEIINDDMPFLLDSVLGELVENGLEVRLVVHPIISVIRDEDGVLTAFRGEAPVSSALRESFIHIHVGRIENDARRAEVVRTLEQILGEVRLCVQDWRPMVSRLESIAANFKTNPPPLPREEIAEAVQFLEWLADNNFTFLGFRAYEFGGLDGDLKALSESGLGVLRGEAVRILRRGRELVSVTPEVMEFLREPKALIITKANVRSRVHRRAHMDYIGVKRFDAEGRLTGEDRFVGLFTATAYTRSARTIPYLRRKVEAVIARAGFDPDSHSGRTLVNVLETYPRDELFQIDEETLFKFAVAIMQLDERPRVRVLARRDRFDRFVSVLVYVPRDRYDSAKRVAIGDFLAETYKGRVSAFYPFFPDGPLVRIHYIIGRYEGETPDPARSTLEQSISAIIRTWGDALDEALTQAHGEFKGEVLFRRYRDAFSAGYREAYSPAIAVEDIRTIENLSALRPIAVNFHGRVDNENHSTRLKVWSHDHPIPLSERVPILENMGFRVIDERTFSVTPLREDDAEIWLHDMLLEQAEVGASPLQALEQRLEACFVAVMRGRTENDGYNALVLTAGIAWREVALLRAISRFLRQIGIPYSQDYMWATLRKHSRIAADIVELFETRFDPRLGEVVGERATRCRAVLTRIESALREVMSLDEDRILRRFVNAVEAALRTNFYQLDPNGQPVPTLAIKFESRKIEGVPAPAPLYEIFVYSPRVEGVHLRFGKVARGGIRWSDRPEDFRTEILGLVKAQQVKNAVIVPVGAKGGFIPKHVPVGGVREAIQAEGVAAYKLFIGSLLDLTDNLGPEGVLPPPSVVRYDGDDPYLVVAADKGTSTFSDIANEIASQRRFWLGDAFASGGSVGYDHKKMGITSRGVWEAVKRHFRELDIDITRTPFTVAGIGDMSGDVFGNGMLRERTIKLLAAFDHRDIFIDPDPDPDASFEERRRLFDLPRSSWQDYDRSLISKGGGIYSRSVKEIHLAPEAQALLRLPSANATPQEVIRAILRMPVDLLWFGGIGTFVRASVETDDAVGDRANDTIRVTATELNCRVIGEGANLGLTQRARIEAARRNIRLNTDAIDNSAGVNTSDLEVNIKIALSVPLRDGRLSATERADLLAEMTEEVASHVLRNNYLQTLAISLAERRGVEELGFLQRLIHALEARGLLDREVECLPDDREIAERHRAGIGFTRPELAVLMAYAKIALFGDLLDSNVPDDPYLARELDRYFPGPLVQRFPDAVRGHRLRREIIATQLANSMINRGGPSLLARIADQTGASAASIATAFAAVRDSYDMPAINGEIDALDGKVAGRIQLDLYAAVQDVLLDRLVWFLRNVDLSRGLSLLVERYRAGIAAMANTLDSTLCGEAAAERAERFMELKATGLSDETARRFASLPFLVPATDVVSIADRSGRAVPDVASTYFAIGNFFELNRIVRAAHTIRLSDHFDRLARDRVLESIGAWQRRLTAEILNNGNGIGTAAVEAWAERRRDEVGRIRTALDGIVQSGLTLSKLAVAASLMGDLVRN
jgi:glutamate dehydrogenase